MHVSKYTQRQLKSEAAHIRMTERARALKAKQPMPQFEDWQLSVTNNGCCLVVPFKAGEQVGEIKMLL